MPRARNPDRKKAEEIYLEHKGNIELVKIAEILGVPAGTIRGWKNKDRWDDKLNGTFQENIDKNMERSKTKKKGKVNDQVQEDKATKRIIKEVAANEELTDKQQLFCIYYLKYFNATKAYQKAYGVSYETALVAGPRLLGNVRIKQQIEKLKVERMAGIYLDGKDILQKYIDIAFADISDFVEFGQEEVVLKDDNGNPLLDENGQEITILRNYVNFKNSNEVDGTIINEVSKGKDGVKIKLADKMKALEFLANNIGLLSVQDQARVELEKTKIRKLVTDIERIEGDEDALEKLDKLIEAIDNEAKR